METLHTLGPETNADTLKNRILENLFPGDGRDARIFRNRFGACLSIPDTVASRETEVTDAMLEMITDEIRMSVDSLNVTRLAEMFVHRLHLSLGIRDADDRDFPVHASPGIDEPDNPASIS